MTRGLIAKIAPMRAVLAAVAAAAAILAYNHTLQRPLEERDEAAWVFSTYYWRLAAAGDFKNPAWKHADAADHPPVGKYVFGAALGERHAARSLNAKETWFSRMRDPRGAAAFLDALRSVVPMEALQKGRGVSGAAMLLSCALTAAIGAAALSAPAGALAALLLALAPLSRLTARLVTADALFLALMLACLLSQMRLAELLKKDKKPPLLAAAGCGALIGLLFGVKITGVLGLPLLAASIFDKKRLKPALLCAAAAGAAALLCAVLLNPSLWSEPFSFIRLMFAHRAAAVRDQLVLFPYQAAPRLLEQAAGFSRALFAGPDAPSAFTSMLTAALALAGLGSWKAFPKEKPAARVLLIHAAVWTAAALGASKLLWVRYALPALPFVCLAAAHGALSLARDRRRLPLALAALAAAVLLSYPARLLTVERYYASRPEALEKIKAAQAALLP